MNYLIILHNNLPGGAENVAKQLACHLSQTGNTVFIIFIKKKNSDFWNDLEQFENVFLKFNIRIHNLAKSINKQNIDVVYTTHIMINSIVGFLRWCRLIDPKYLVVRESTSVFLRYKGLKLCKYKIAYFLGYNKIDLIITQSDLMKDGLAGNANYLFKRTRVKTIPNPFKFSSEVFNEDINFTKPFIVSAGRLIPEKGFDILIKAFENFIREYSNFNLVILGEGPEREALEVLVKEKNLSNKINLPGFVKNVYQYFETADICVVSSRREGFPNVLLQMMSKNEKVVSTKCAGGIDEIKGLTLCDTNDVLSLSEALKRSFETKTDNARKYFDKELKSRTIKNFMTNIQNNLYG